MREHIVTLVLASACAAEVWRAPRSAELLWGAVLELAWGLVVAASCALIVVSNTFGVGESRDRCRDLVVATVTVGGAGLGVAAVLVLALRAVPAALHVVVVAGGAVTLCGLVKQ